MANYKNELFTAFTGKIDASFTKSVQGVSNSLTQLAGKSTSAVKPLQGTNSAAKGGSPAVAKYGIGLSSVGGALSQIVRYSIAGSIIGGITMAFAQGVSAIIDYDQSLKNLQAITGASGTDIAQFGETIQRVSNSTKFSSSEVAEAMVNLGQAGLSANEAIGAIDSVAALATGTLTDFKTTADLVTTTMRAFNLSADQASRIADVFAISVNRSKLTIDKIRTSFNFVGAAAAQAGATLEETATAMQVLANAGIRASTIGTGLRNLFARLTAPTSKLKLELAALGIEVESIDPSVVGFQRALQNFLPVITDAETGAISAGKAVSLFGLRGQQAAVLIGRAFSSGQFSDVLENTKKLGEATRQQITQQQGLGVQVKNLADRWKNLAVVLGEAGITSLIRALVDMFSTLALALQKVVRADISLRDAIRILNGDIKTQAEVVVKNANAHAQAAAEITKYIQVLQNLADSGEDSFEIEEQRAIILETMAEKFPQVAMLVRGYTGDLKNLIPVLTDVANAEKALSAETVARELVLAVKRIKVAEEELEGLYKKQKQLQSNVASARTDRVKSYRSLGLAQTTAEITALEAKVANSRKAIIEYQAQLAKSGEGIGDVNIEALKKQQEALDAAFAAVGGIEETFSRLGKGWETTFNKLFAEGDTKKILMFVSAMKEAQVKAQDAISTISEVTISSDVERRIRQNSKSTAEAEKELARVRTVSAKKTMSIVKSIYATALADVKQDIADLSKPIEESSKKVYTATKKELDSTYKAQMAATKAAVAEKEAEVVAAGGTEREKIAINREALQTQLQDTSEHYTKLKALVEANKKLFVNEKTGDDSEFKALLGSLDSSQAATLSKILKDVAKNNADLAKDLQDNPEDFAEAWDAALKKVRESTQQNFSKVRDFIAGTIDDIADWGADAFIDFTTGTKSAAEAFSDMATSILRDITKMIIKQQILNAIMAGVGSMSTSGGILGSVGGFLNDAFSSNHSGGMAGKASSVKKRMDPNNFINAPRFHSGGEVPAVLERGEVVQTREQAAQSREPRNVRVVIENKTGTQVGSATATSSINMGEEVIRIVIDGINRNRSGLRTAVSSAR